MGVNLRPWKVSVAISSPVSSRNLLAELTTQEYHALHDKLIAIISELIDVCVRSCEQGEEE